MKELISIILFLLFTTILFAQKDFNLDVYCIQKNNRAFLDSLVPSYLPINKIIKINISIWMTKGHNAIELKNINIKEDILNKILSYGIKKRKVYFRLHDYDPLYTFNRSCDIGEMNIYYVLS